MAEQTAAVNRQVQLQEAFKLALSMTLFYWLALWMNWDLPKYGALAIIVVSLSTTGASLNKGVMRIAGTGLGALAGFALLSWFAQSPTGILLGVSVYLLVIGYFMQTSRQADTWFNAGFIAVAVWSSSYMKVDTAFHFASIRFLETAAGVSVFTLVSTLLWPRTSGQLLPQQGKSLWTDLQTLFGMYRQHLQGQALTDDTAELRIRLAGAYQKLLSTLEGAYADTPAVKHNKAAWELLRVDLQAFAAAQELWRESIADCKQLPLDRLLPGLDMTLDAVAGRLVRGTALWLAQADPDHVQAGDDTALLTQPDMTVDPAAFAALTLFQQAVLMNFVEQLKSLETNSRDLLQTLRVLAGLDPADRLHVMTQKAEPFRPVRWNPERLLKAVFPTLCWITAWVFWVYVQPPGGPVVPMMATVFGLMMVMAPVNLLGLLLVLLLSMFIVVAPVYLLLMPTLDSGFAILALIFVYTFCFGFLGGISPVLKIGPLLMFVNVANITNDQTYSFILLITGGLVMLMGVSIVVVVHRLLSPMHAEQILLRTLRRFFHGCAQITAAYAPVPAARMTAANKRRRRVFENRIQPLPEQLQAAMKSLDYSQFPDNDEARVSDLANNLYSLRTRLRAVETSFNSAATGSAELLHAVQTLKGDWRRRTREVFEKWSRLESADSLLDAWRNQPELSRDLQQQLDRLQHDGAGSAIDETGTQGLYALLGSIKGLLESMEKLQESMNSINWAQYSTPRF